MKCFHSWSAVAVGGLCFCFLASGCRGDGDYGDDDFGGGNENGNGSASIEEACERSCDCQNQGDTPECESLCRTGLRMLSDPEECADCILDVSCEEYESGECNSECGGDMGFQ